jgi:hypothetical protein
MEYTFTVNDTEVLILGEALGELPFKKSSNLVIKLNKQLQDQQTAAQEITKE